MKKICFVLSLILISYISYGQKETSKKSKDDMYGIADSVKNKRQYSAWNPMTTKPFIYKDVVNSNGHRFITTSGRTVNQNMNTNKVSCQVYLGAAMSKEVSPIYNMILSVSTISNSRMVIEPGSPVLFKLSDGEILKLQVYSGSSDFIGQSLFIYDYLFTVTRGFAKIEVDDDIMSKIKKGVSKIRLEINNEPVDIILKKDNISDFLCQTYDILKNQTKISKDFEDGF